MQNANTKLCVVSNCCWFKCLRSIRFSRIINNPYNLRNFGKSKEDYLLLLSIHINGPSRQFGAYMLLGLNGLFLEYGRRLESIYRKNLNNKLIIWKISYIFLVVYISYNLIHAHRTAKNIKYEHVCACTRRSNAHFPRFNLSAPNNAYSEAFARAGNLV